MRKIIVAGILIFTTLNVFKASAQNPNGDNQFQQEFLYRINSVRQKGCNCGVKWMPPVGALTWNNQLQKSAYGHAKDMEKGNYFSHTSKDGRTMQTRIVNAGYDYNGFQSFFIGENIAFGQQSIAQVMDEWFKSEGHCHNLMNPNFKEIGVSQYNQYWVQDFGGRTPWTPEQQKALKEGAKIVKK